MYRAPANPVITREAGIRKTGAHPANVTTSARDKCELHVRFHARQPTLACHPIAPHKTVSVSANHFGITSAFQNLPGIQPTI